MKAILLKELRSYLRGARPFTLISFYLAILGGLMVLIYAGETSSRFVNRASIGLTLFNVVIGLALVQMVFIAPAMNASSLGSERDFQTIDLLMITPVKPINVIIGKLAAPCLFLLLLGLATLPLAGFAFLIGGIEIRDLLVGLALLVISTFSYGTIGIWAAARSRTSRGGTLTAQVIVLMLALGVPVVAGIVATLLGEEARRGSAFAEWLLTSPLIRWPVLALLSLSPLAGLVSWLVAVDNGASPWWHDMPAELGGGRVPVLWLISLVVWAIVIPFLLWRSSLALPRSVAKQGGG